MQSLRLPDSLRIGGLPFGVWGSGFGAQGSASYMASSTDMRGLKKQKSAGKALGMI